MKLRTRRGSIVIVALWALAFFTMLTVTLAARMQSQISFVKRFQEARAAENAAANGISYALAVLEKQAAAKEAETEGGPAAPGAASRFAVFEGGEAAADPRARFEIGHFGENAETGAQEFVFGFEDEESRINVNTASAAALAYFYQYGGDMAQETAQVLAQATLEWRQRQKEFKEFGHTLKEGGAGLGSVEELLLVPGMNPALWQKLKGHATVLGSGGVNLNTVRFGTLKALGVSELLAQRIVQFRDAQRESLNFEDPSSGQVFTSLDDLTQKVGDAAELQALSELWTFESGTVRFVARASGQAKNGIECVATREGRVLSLRNL